MGSENYPLTLHLHLEQIYMQRLNPLQGEKWKWGMEIKPSPHQFNVNLALIGVLHIHYVSFKSEKKKNAI